MNKRWTSQQVDFLINLVDEDEKTWDEITLDLNIKFGTNFSSKTVTQQYYNLRKKGTDISVTNSENHKDKQLYHAIVDQNDKLKKDFKKERVKTQQIIDACVATLAKFKFKPVKPPKIKRERKKQHELEMHLLRSDAQVGEVVDPQLTSGLGLYNFDIYKNRLDTLLHKTVLFYDQDHKSLGLNKLVSPQLGDHVEGENIYKGQSFYIDKPLVDQVFESLQVEVNRFWIPLANIFPEIELYCIAGNHGRCYSENIQLLTEDGWKDYTDIKKGEIVPTFNLETNKVENNPLEEVHIFNNEPIIIKGTNNNSCGVEVTPDHTMIYRDRDKKYKRKSMKDLIKLKSADGIPKCVPSGKIVDFPDITDDELKLIGIILTDGSVPALLTHNSFMLYQSKVDNVIIIKNLLESLNIKFTDKIRNYNVQEIQGVELKSQLKDSHELYLNSGEEVIKLRKLLPTRNIQKWMYNLSDRQVNKLLEGIVIGDGTIRKNSGKIVELFDCKTEGVDRAECIYGTKKFLSDLQGLLITHNIPCTLKVPKEGGFFNPETSCVLFLLTKKHFTLGKDTVIETEYNKTSWCVTVKNHTLFVRNKTNGKAFICGNSGQKGENHVKTNWDYVYYKVLQSMLGFMAPNIKIFISECPMMLVQHGDFIFCYSHGSSTSSWNGIPYYGLDRSASKANTMFNKIINYHCIGHFHSPANLNNRTLINGTLVGGSQLSINQMSATSVPSQKMFYFHPKYGINRESDLFLDSQVNLVMDKNGIFTPIS